MSLNNILLDKLWYDSKNKTYVLTDINKLCDHCKEKITIKADICFFFRQISKKSDKINFFCMTCHKVIKKDLETKHCISNVAIIMNEAPKNALLVLKSRIGLKGIKGDVSEGFVTETNINTCDIDSINKKGGFTNNQAKRSGHSDYTVLDDSAPVQIGACVDEDKEVEKDKLLESEDEFDSLLLGFKDEQVLIGDEEDEVKKLE